MGEGLSLVNQEVLISMGANFEAEDGEFGEEGRFEEGNEGELLGSKSFRWGPPLEVTREPGFERVALL